MRDILYYQYQIEVRFSTYFERAIMRCGFDIRGRELDFIIPTHWLFEKKKKRPGRFTPQPLRYYPNYVITFYCIRSYRITTAPRTSPRLDNFPALTSRIFFR